MTIINAEQRKERNPCTGSGKQPGPVFSQVFVVVSAFIAILQGLFFLLSGIGDYYNVTGVLLAVVTTFFAKRYMATREEWSFRFISFLLLVQCGFFMVNLARTVPPFPFRLLQVAIFVSYFVILLVIVSAATKLFSPVHAFIVVGSTALGLLMIEAIQELPYFSWSPIVWDDQVEWLATFEDHPVLGKRYAPNSEVRTYYPDNPRSYFTAADIRETWWRLNVHEDTVAKITFPTDDPEKVRVDIEKGDSQIPWHIQLNQGRLSVKAGQSYALLFRARADLPRQVMTAMSRNHQPWDNLGLYEAVALTSQWQEFRLEFVAAATDDNARIHFDVGGSDSSVDLSAVKLLSLPGGQVVEPNVKTKYFISYRMNNMGCRGPEYSLTKQKGTIRILALGDSYTMGVGVHEKDTFAHQLELLLNGQSDRSPGTTYEVINCGHSGYSTRDERLFYEELGQQYNPDVVLLVMYSNDDLSWNDEQNMPHIRRQPDSIEYLFYTWGRVQQYRNRRPFPDYSITVTETLRLQNSIGKHNGRLAIVLFRDIPRSNTGADGRYWNLFATTVEKGLQGIDIPMLDLCDAFFTSHSREELFVHPIDEHTNEIGHAIAAQEILRFLRTKGLLKSNSAN